MGGTIEVDSRPGRTVFSLTLPPPEEHGSRRSRTRSARRSFHVEHRCHDRQRPDGDGLTRESHSYIQHVPRAARLRARLARRCARGRRAGARDRQGIRLARLEYDDGRRSTTRRRRRSRRPSSRSPRRFRPPSTRRRSTPSARPAWSPSSARSRRATQGTGVGLRRLPEGLRAHERARDHDCAGPAGRARLQRLRRVLERRPRGRRDHRLRPVLRRRRASRSTPASHTLTRAPARRLVERCRGRAGGGDRQPVRERELALGRRRLGHEAFDLVRDVASTS